MTDIRTNFSLIKLVPKVTTLQKIDLNSIFKAVLSGDVLELDETHLKYILENDLTINISKLDERLVKVLSESLIYFMSIWPGWQRSSEYQKGQLQYNDWFEKYRMYLIYKSNFVLTSAPKYTKSTTKGHNQSTQTEEKVVAKKVAPFTLFIGGPPAVLNNIVFIEKNGDVVIKQHAGKEWKTLTVTEFLNWPYVAVKVDLPDFKFTRTVSHVYERFVGLKGDTMTFPEMNHIVHITKLKQETDLQPYSYRFFQCYFTQLMKVLGKLPAISQDRITELRFILMQFVKDIEEINVYNKTMSTNACVGFRIGNCRYIRNKKMVNNTVDRNGINFYEIINPQINLTLARFDVKQDMNNPQQHDPITFESLNQLLFKCNTNAAQEDVTDMVQVVNERCITYTCTLCREHFSGSNAYDQISAHFWYFHKSEQCVLCFKCGKQFEVNDLAGQRWTHPCQAKK
ncbi:hypothetical protein RN001_014267 [Aquatica leii]|uniref:Uncharacterized protein n=1 Tax=Aquatica leii TaxID=1421715 RepID=A0AAN7SCS5_9COLE|nr:hypothetical protein RN001_014267 [Aquatica leii]